ncbi:MAG TPA: hypothetical protein VHT91_39450 [Kofleriaceae bacterium]|jgi:hypothetical protein|nr:hypothetical protein [Kofleriaceae bacterium]
MSEPHLALVVVLVLVVALVALLLLVEGVYRRRADAARALRPPRSAQAAPRLAVRARRCNGKGAELAVDVAAHGWPAIAAVTVLVAAVTACVLVWFIG